MPISSLIIRTDQDKTKEVAQRLEAMKEATVSEVHGQNIVLVTETKTQDQDEALWEEIKQVPGVLQCDLIFHNFEDQEGFCDAH